MKDKYVKRALKTLGLVVEREGVEINTKKDIKNLIKEFEQYKVDFQNSIEEIKDSIITCDEVLSDLNNLFHQVDVEEYEDLNKGKNITIM